MEILSDATFKGKIIAENGIKVPAENLKLFYDVADLSNGSNDYVRFELTEFFTCSNPNTATLKLSGFNTNRLRVDGMSGINVYGGPIKIKKLDGVGTTYDSFVYLETPVAKITEFVINENSRFTKYDGNYGDGNGSEFRRCLTFPRTLTEFYCRGVNPYEIVVNNKLDDALKSLTEFYIQKGTDLSGSYQKKDCSTVFAEHIDIGFDVAASCTKFSVDMPWVSNPNAIPGYNVIDLKMTKGTNPISPVNMDLEARCDSGNGWKIVATKSSSFAMSSADNYKIHILGVKPY